MSEEEWRAEIEGTPDEFRTLVERLVPKYVVSPPSVDEIWRLVAQISEGLDG